MIYAKFRTHLRCFSSQFTLESARARTRARSAARDFHAVILGPICCYKTYIGFTLNFVLIYAVLAHGLRWNPTEPEPEPHTAWFMLSSTCHYRVVNAVHSVIFVPRDSVVKRFLYAWFTHLYPYIYIYMHSYIALRLSFWILGCRLHGWRKHAGAGSTASWLGLPLVGEAQGFYYLFHYQLYCL
jgi:hypothetical protein